MKISPKDKKLLKKIEKEMLENGWHKNKEGNWTKELSPRASAQLDATMGKYKELLALGLSNEDAWKEAKKYGEEITSRPQRIPYPRSK